MTELEDVRDVVVARRAGRATAKQQADVAWKGLKTWLRRTERDLYRPGHIFMAALVCGIAIGMSIVAIAWMAVDSPLTIQLRHDNVETSSGGGGGGGRTLPPDQNSW